MARWQVQSTIAVVVLATAGVGVWLFLTAGRESTDDAQLDAHEALRVEVHCTDAVVSRRRVDGRRLQ